MYVCIYIYIYVYGILSHIRDKCRWYDLLACFGGYFRPVSRRPRRRRRRRSRRSSLAIMFLACMRVRGSAARVTFSPEPPAHIYQSTISWTLLGSIRLFTKKKNFTTNGKGTLIGGKKGSIQWKVARHFPMNAPFF